MSDSDLFNTLNVDVYKNISSNLKLKSKFNPILPKDGISAFSELVIEDLKKLHE